MVKLPRINHFIINLLCNLVLHDILLQLIIHTLIQEILIILLFSFSFKGYSILIKIQLHIRMKVLWRRNEYNLTLLKRCKNCLTSVFLNGMLIQIPVPPLNICTIVGAKDFPTNQTNIKFPSLRITVTQTALPVLIFHMKVHEITVQLN